MLKIAVLLKFYKGEISLFDASAYECALTVPDAEVTLVAMAPESCKEPLRQLTRLGAKRAILISDTVYAGSDTLATSKVLAKALKELTPDIVLSGRQSMDGDTAQVPSQVATFLGYNLITNAMEFNLAEIKTRIGTRKVDLPSVISVERIKTLRFPSLRSKPICVEVWNNSVLKLPLNECGALGSPTRVLKVYDKNPTTRKCKFISLSELPFVIKESLNKPKVKIELNTSQNKLDKIFIVGDWLDEIASTLAKEVVKIDSEDPTQIASEIKRLNAKRVLFNASIKNRTIAPCVSALLNTGLAADCIGVETDGKNMFVYRPASSDSVVAKIGFNCDVEMATVRTVLQTDNDLIFSVGYGAKDFVSDIKKMAEKFGAELTASRKVVDNGILEYERQVGLTGKIVSPKVYVAFGISGAVQHTVGMENSTTVIAINNDKNAKIFDYADYGVTEDIKNVKL